MEKHSRPQQEPEDEPKHERLQPHFHGDVPPIIPTRLPGDPGPDALAHIEDNVYATYLTPFGEHVPVEMADNPSPTTSFGYVNRFVQVGDEEALGIGRGTLVIRLDPEGLGTVARETLRVFRWDDETQRHQLVHRSGIGQTRDYVWAQIPRSGHYSVIGVNADPLMARTLGLLRYMEGWIGGTGEYGRVLQRDICQLILCAQDFLNTARDPMIARAMIEDNLRLGLPGAGLGAVLPGNFGGNVCDMCLGAGIIDIDGWGRPSLPELEIVPTICIPAPADTGRWDVLPMDSQILAVHAALLATGKVLYFAGDEHDQGQSETSQVDHTRIWDPATGVLETVGSPNHDLFCCGHAFLGDGRLLVAGGTQKWPVHAGGQHRNIHFSGLRDATIFDPNFPIGESPWSAAAPMLTEPDRGNPTASFKQTGGGRWYPTLVTLMDGRILAMSGHPEDTDSRHNNTLLEVYDVAVNTWSDAHDQLNAPDSYPRLHLLPDGEVFCTTPMAGRTWAWMPSNGQWRDVSQGLGDEYAGFNTSSVLLPLMPEDGYQPKILVVGAAQPQIIAPMAGEAWKPTSARRLSNSPVRNHANAVLLPDGSVCIVGGSQTAQDSDAVLAAEQYDPVTDAWTVLATAAVPRLYHSVALLLPDGRVWTAGSNFNCQPGLANRELRMEVFSPPYLFRGPRPTIAVAPAKLMVPSRTADIPQTFEIQSPDAHNIHQVALIRCGSVTHAFNFDQRYIGLIIRHVDRNILTVTLPPSKLHAPPGYYLLFILDKQGVPSVGHFIQVV